jgi:hypothetical protein
MIQEAFLKKRGSISYRHGKKLGIKILFISAYCSLLMKGEKMKKIRLLTVLVAFGFLIAACSKKPATTPPELTKLMERVAIEELFYDYYAQFRPDSKHEFDSFFTADAHLDVNGFVVDGRDKIKTTYSQIDAGGEKEKKKAEKAVPGGMGEMVVTNLKIDLQGDRAVATLLWHAIMSDLVTSAPKVIEYGRERTELVKQDGRWLISRRVVLTEGGMPEGLLASYPKK